MAVFSKEFDFPERFEREKSTRILPTDLKRMGFYTFRVMFPPGMTPFAVDFMTVVTEIEQEPNSWDVTMAIQPVPHGGPELARCTLNLGGFAIVDNSRGEIPGAPAEIEMAYFVGSTDPYDLELAELVAQANNLAGSTPMELFPTR